MSIEEKRPDSETPELDRAIEEIRNEPVEAAAVEAAAQRVWARMAEPAVETIRTCADFRALIPARVAGRLPEARALLLDDHTRECPACRKALEAARSNKVVEFEPRPARRRPGLAPKWAVAAAVVLGAGLAGVWSVNRFWPVPAGSRATVQTVDGALYKMAAETAAPIVKGAPIEQKEMIRTARGSGAVVRLRDGSLVEMKERTELSLSEDGRGATIRLGRGSIIVQAAKQRSRHLYVATEDCTVSVTGTVFSVNHGMKGSRVSVLEGEVQVERGGETRVLKPGDQFASDPSLGAAPIQEEIAWSRNADAYTALLNDITELRKKLAAIPGPPPHYTARLAELAPEDTVIYASIPNLGQTLGEAHRILIEQVQESPALREWWSEQAKNVAIEQVLGRIRAFSEYLGPEIVLTVSNGPGGKYDDPLFLSEAARSGLRPFLEDEIKKLAQHGAVIRIVEDPARETARARVPGQGGEVLVLLRGNIVAVSTGLAQIQNLAARIDRHGPGGFTRTPFYAKIGEAYRGGVNWLLCADLQTILGRSPDKSPVENLRKLGIDDVRYLIVERKEAGSKSENRATLTFAQARHGLMSWLAPPSPIGALDFVSPEATLAAAFAVKEPARMVEDLLAMYETDAWKGLAEFEARTGVNVRADVAKPLGGEFVLAMDGPVLPAPSWKLVLEVYDPATLQAALEKLIEAANVESRTRGGQQTLRIEREEIGGRAFFTLRGLPIEAHYVYASGYLVAAPSRPLLLRALQSRETGDTLLKSGKFTALMPSDSQPNFSAMVYNDLGSVVGPLVQQFGGSGQHKAIPREPSLILVYGGPDRIQLAATGGNLFGFGFEEALLGLKNPLGRHGRVKRQ